MLVWWPLARGFLSSKYRPGQAPPPGTRVESWQDSYKAYDNDRMWTLVDLLGQIAERHATTCAAVALAWLLAPGGDHRDRRRPHRGAAPGQPKALEVKLTAEDVAALDTLEADPGTQKYDPNATKSFSYAINGCSRTPMADRHGKMADRAR